MCFNVDQGLIVAGLVLLAILALLFLARVWIACGDYLLRRRMTSRQYVVGSSGRFQERLAERLVGSL
ncbi:hypothetical protein ACSFBX_03735 [Variovorax sp. RB2P76]|uniref:hypothetical protein n=1 Tax=Variovorax sp. RB2P76 TaxID=3443736 RepID=UPI003F48072D